MSTMEPTCAGEKRCPFASTHASPSSLRTILNGDCTRRRTQARTAPGDDSDTTGSTHNSRSTHNLDGLLHFRVVELAADESLGRVERVGGVCHRLTLRGNADQALAVLSDGDNRRRRARTLGVLDDSRRTALRTHGPTRHPG
jgi:hypothetical protein